MKQLQYPILAVIIQLTAPNSYASLRTDVPKPKLGLTEAQINAIKNERGRPSKSSSVGLFNDDNSEELEQLLQARLREVSHLTHFRDHTSLDKALTFSGLALQAWNPELRHTDTKTMIVKNIINYGFMDGFIVPTMSLMDMSYATGNSGFGTLLNVMLNDITPGIAEHFKNKYGIPTEFRQKDFDQISNQARNTMWMSLISQLDPDFYQEHTNVERDFASARLDDGSSVNPNTKFKDITSNDQFDNFSKVSDDNTYYGPQEYDSAVKKSDMNDFINVALKGNKTALAHFLKKMGKEDKSQKIYANRNSGMNSTPTNNPNEKTENKYRGVFSADTKVNAWECTLRCTKDIITYGGTAGTIGLLGGPVTAGILGGAGVLLGADECSRHQLCGGDGIRRKKGDNKEPDESKNESSPKKHEPKAGDNDPKTIDNDDDLTDTDSSDTDEDSATYPVMPSENGPKKTFTPGNKDLIMKVNVKETTAQRTDVGIIYPTSPNIGD